jgi:nicotinamidase-related amidase
MSQSVSLAIMGDARRDDFEKSAPQDPDRTALIIVDMQYYSGCRTLGLGKHFASEGRADLVAWRFDRIERTVIPNIKKPLRVFRAKGYRVIYITLGSRTDDLSDAARHMKKLFQTYNGRVGTPEADILKEIEPVPGEFVFNKTTVGAFASTALDVHLRHHRVERLFFAGISTSACVGHTACFAADLEYDCAIVGDCCADLRQADHDWFLEHYQRFFGRVLSADAVIAELAAAGAPTAVS